MLCFFVNTVAIWAAYGCVFWRRTTRAVARYLRVTCGHSWATVVNDYHLFRCKASPYITDFRMSQYPFRTLTESRLHLQQWALLSRCVRCQDTCDWQSSYEPNSIFLIFRQRRIRRSSGINNSSCLLRFVIAILIHSTIPATTQALYSRAIQP